ncbi:MAG TPA: hypothetical protein VFD84_09930 [Candidatus Binatia bacterium]|nr:hypothetical protein [Candidatus Binatia bacterium]
MAQVEKRGDVLWSGDNPLIVLKDPVDGRERTALALFQVDHAPAGAGHAAFVITGLPEERVFCCFTDHEPLGRWLRDEIVGTLPELASHDFRDMPIRPARFVQLASPGSWSVLVATPERELRLTWSALEPPFNLRVPAGTVASIPFDLETMVYRARHAEVTLGGRLAPGTVVREADGGSSAFLALNETWYR